MWSMGCAFYELCTKEFLFYDGDWGAFFARVTSGNMPLISAQRKALINGDPLLLEFLEYVFIRDPVRRPSIEDVIKRFGVVKRRVAQRSADAHAAAAANKEPLLWDMIGHVDEREETPERTARSVGS